MYSIIVDEFCAFLCHWYFFLLPIFSGDIETLEPDVKILSLAIKSTGRPDIILPIPESGKPKGLWFTLKEGSQYSLKFTFQVNNNIVSGLRYTNTVWKAGLKGNSLYSSLSSTQIFGLYAKN